MCQDTTLCYTGCTFAPVRHALDPCAAVRCAKHRVAQMLVEHERLVHWVVHRQWLGELSYAAAVPAGRLALWRVAQSYDVQRGTAFSSYAVPAIQRAVWRAVTEAQSPAGEQCWGKVPQLAVDPEREVLRRLMAELVGQWVAQLPQRLAYVIVAHYGLADEPPQSFAHIGQRLGITRQRAEQLHREAGLFLAQPSRSLALRQWLGCNTVADYRAFLAQQRRWLRRRRSR
jgi:RNA polymerase sigma factor (sigma-70 family)